MGNTVKTERMLVVACAVCCFILAVPIAAEAASPTEELLELSLEQLMEIEVSSVSKKPQALAEAAAAVFVITQDDIRRSGATSIPEVLRMAPGVQVARIDGNRWAVTIRGFNGRFANKLLVLLDGRSLYTPLFAGVFWDVADTVLEDIERIEVIRGPGASLWGANAVNGIINIITKRAGDTKGGLLVGGAGDKERGFATLRYGGELGDQGDYRVYAKYFNRDGNVAALTGTNTADDWDQWRAGFRLDWSASARDALTLQGDIYRGSSGQTAVVPVSVPLRQTLVDGDDDVAGGNLLVRWRRAVSDTEGFTLKLYYDRTERDGVVFKEDRDTFDIDFQQRLSPGERHDLIWGLEYRYTRDDFSGNTVVDMNPSSRSDQMFSAFFQDDITLAPETLRLTLGSKFEHNDYSGFEIQPTIRMLWTPNRRQSLWGSVSRAVRTPARGDHDLIGIGPREVIPAGNPQNPFPVPIGIPAFGDEDIDSEQLIAYELGYRMQMTKQLSIDAAAFYNDYDKLRSAATGAPVCQPSGTAVADSPGCVLAANSITLPIVLGDGTKGETYGAELSLDWRPTQRWRLQAAYSHLRMHLHGAGNSGDELPEGESPRNQFSLRSSLDLRPDLGLDLWLRYVDNLPALDIDHYLALDARLAWRPHRDLELSVVGQNLLDDRHEEFVSELRDVPRTEIERSVYGKIKWSF